MLKKIFTLFTLISENSYRMILTDDNNDIENMHTIQISEEQQSSLLSNNSDMDNEYEYPYKSVVAKSEDEDNNVYRTTKHCSINKNTYLSIHGACEQSVEIIVNGYTSDNERIKM